MISFTLHPLTLTAIVLLLIGSYIWLYRATKRANYKRGVAAGSYEVRLQWQGAMSINFNQFLLIIDRAGDNFSQATFFAVVDVMCLSNGYADEITRNLTLAVKNVVERASSVGTEAEKNLTTIKRCKHAADSIGIDYPGLEVADGMDHANMLISFGEQFKPKVPDPG